MYRGYMITIGQKDLPKAMEIILKHDSEGDLDMISRHISGGKPGELEITFKLHPYIYEDFETIKNEFEQAGIQIL